MKKQQYGEWTVTVLDEPGNIPASAHMTSKDGICTFTLSFDSATTLVKIAINDVRRHESFGPDEDGFWVHGQGWGKVGKWYRSQTKAAVAYLIALHGAPDIRQAMFAFEQLHSWMGWPEDEHEELSQKG